MRQLSDQKYSWQLGSMGGNRDETKTWKYSIRGLLTASKMTLPQTDLPAGAHHVWRFLWSGQALPLVYLDLQLNIRLPTVGIDLTP